MDNLSARGENALRIYIT